MLRLRRIVAILLVIVFLDLPGAAYAEDYSEIVRIQKNIEALSTEIEDADVAVTKAMEKLNIGVTPDVQQGIHQAVDRYTQIASNNTHAIDGYYRSLLDLDPNARPPSIKASNSEGTVKALMTEIEANQRELDAIQTGFLAAEKIYQDIISVAEKEQDETKARNFWKGLAWSGAKMALIAAVGYFTAAPTLIAVGFVTVTEATLPLQALSVIETAYTWTHTPPELRAIQRKLDYYKKQLEDARAQVDSLKPAAANLEALNQGLKGDADKFAKSRDDIDKVTQGWPGYAEGAKRRLSDKEKHDLDARLNQPRQTIQTSGPPVKPIEPAEYMDEAKSIVAEMESAFQAATQGGDPDALQDIAARKGSEIRSRYKAATETLNARGRAQSEAYNVYCQACNAASAAYWNAIGGRCWACDPRVFEAAYAAYCSGCNAAFQAYLPYDTATREAQRELTRLNMLHNVVADAMSDIRGRLYSYAGSTSTQFSTTMWQKQQEYVGDNAEMYALFQKVPDIYTLRYYKDESDRLDSDVEFDLYWYDLYTVRNSLIGKANAVKAYDVALKTYLPQACSALETRRQEGKSVANELKAKLDADGKLIASYWDSSIYHYGMPYLWDSGESWRRTSDDRHDRLAETRKSIDDRLSIADFVDVKTLGTFDCAAIAAKYDAKAEELEYQLAQIEMYRGRKEVAAYRLDAFSKEYTKKDLYAAHPKGPVETALDDLRKDEWAAVANQAESLKPIWEKGPKAPYDNVLWDSKTPRQKLLAVTNTVYMRAQTILRDYISVRANGGFVRAQTEADYEQLAADWTLVMVVLKAFDAAAARFPAKAQDDLTKMGEYGKPVYDAFGALPERCRNVVASEHREYMGASQWLASYIAAVIEGTRLMLDPKVNSVVPQVDEWLTGYPKDKVLDAERQAKAEAEMAKAREAQAKIEAERKAKEDAEKQKLADRSAAEEAAAKALYDQFKQAYESRNESKVMSLISDAWKSNDSTTLADLEEHLHNSFTVFDEIRYAISGLKVDKIGERRFKATYDLVITGRIFENNIKHEEKSSVGEEVTVDERGKAKITRTLEGRFWYVQ